MNEDFGVGRRRNTNSTNNGGTIPELPRPVIINPDKYRPMGSVAPQPTSQQPGPKPNPLHGQAASGTFGIGNSFQDRPKSSSPDISLTLDDNATSSPGNKATPGPSKWGRFKAFLASRTKKQWIIFGVIVFLVTAGSAMALAMVLKNDAPPKTATATKEAAPKPIEKPKSPLTGMEVSEEDTKRPVISVMIENSTFARPQSGLKDAGVVYEAIAEYGITRFLALYQEANPGNVGPVRSARPYYVDWARSYDASYAHVGGSPDALAKIKSEGIRDLDQFANSGAYRRVSQREAPHNVYTSMQQLRDLTAKKGWTSSAFTGLSRKKEAPAKTVTANAIDIAISGPTYDVHYDYDVASNSYHRTMGGAPHNDADSGARIAPKVVIGLATAYGKMPDGYHSTYNTTGSGTVKIFQDGTVTEGTWTREGTANYKFQDAGGKAIDLVPGQAWITVVGDPAAIKFTAPAPPAATPTP